ncbi:DUF3883 domain-containing protein [Actinomadura sp. K4S16]|uniref:DUF3883 domain-containing protein n=1 Tax=Actinomadura sp. K4S16 TaxID=1316147 RepID=UPI001357649E|nr:DUF3883 domain-containing protein [Actinomadura sp. K4S16]
MGRDVPDHSLVPANSAELEFRFHVGSSLLIEFALSHTSVDVLRELVQNEYDAGGTELVVEFGPDALKVRGNGKTIDRAGWKRLSVMLGHGLIPDAADRVEPKSNGIGSKNFGLRSLFLLGDRINIMSGGRRTILDRTKGALAEPLPHPDSSTQPGVTLVVPYRKRDDGPLRAFDEHHEAEALKAIAAEFAPTLIKLAHPGPGKNLQSVVLCSERLGHELRWRQSARAGQRGSGLIKRTAKLEEHGPSLAHASGTISEREYQRVLIPPAALRRPNVPSYFQVPGGRIRLGVSVRTRRRGLDLETPGIFYYPMGAIRARTGFGFSISAPFEMTEDRSQLVDPQNSDWNAWLVEQAAAFAVRLLAERLFVEFGAQAFLAFDPRAAGSSTVPALREEIDRLLRSESCWPTQATTGRAKRSLRAPVESLTIPANPALAAFRAGTSSPDHLLHSSLVTRPETQAMAVALGGKAFTVSSLIRLRCAGENARELATKLDQATEVARYYTDFPDALRDLTLQQHFAAALDGCRTALTADHRRDLRTAPTTLTGAGTLGSPKGLWIVDEAVADVISWDQTLHPDLVDSKVLAGLCRPFNFTRWAIETASRLVDGTASEQARDALARYIRGRPTLSRKAWAAVRRAPVLQDHNGEWVAPANMVSRSAKGATLLAPALHLSTPADEDNDSLKPLRFRQAVRGSDIVALARLVEQGTVPPEVMRQAIARLQRLLSLSVLTHLKTIKFLETGPGTATAPSDAYNRSDHLVAVLGEDAPYAVGMSTALLRRLGCRTEPRADDILAALMKLQESGSHVTKPDLVYRALVSALRRERRRAGELRDRQVIWTGSRWEAAGNCLVGADNRSAFLDVVTVLPEALRDTWVFLGATQRPTPAHWRRLFVRVSELYGAQRPIPRHVAEALRRAYHRLDAPPEGLAPGTHLLLDDQRGLHTLKEATTEGFLINDDPALAAAAVAARVPVSFADTSDGRVIGFLEAAGTRPLSKAAKREDTEYGSEIEPDQTLRLDITLARLHDPNFASAVAALASAVSGPDQSRTVGRLTARLARITQITLVNGIQRKYRVGGHALTVAVDYNVDDNQIVLDQVASSHEQRRLVANAVAGLADSGPLGERLLGDAVYFLLRCRSAREMQRELERRKVNWRPRTPGTEYAEDADDEDLASLSDALSQHVVREAMSKPLPDNSGSQKPPTLPAARALRPPLPDLGRVQALPAERTATPSHKRQATAGSGGSGAWTPRSYQESEDDREVGRRGEEIVLAIERERVRQLGFSPDRVRWVADANPGSDHDIVSVDDDGAELWVEVKSTTSRQGQFVWPAAEFQLAVRARQRYVLYRVYEANTTTPSWRCIRDPIGLFDAGELHLDLNRLTGDVGPLAGPS